MKHRTVTYLFPFLLLFPAALIAQDCLPEGIAFRSQAALDAFAKDYPGCSRILGNVVIEEAVRGDITDLKGLAQVTAFEQYLEIHDNAALHTLSGLDAVSSIGGLNIFGNPTLRDLTGLEALVAVPNSLRLAYNHELLDLSGLKGLATIGEDLTITDHQQLPSLRGMEALHSVGGYLILVLNEQLVTLQGLDALTAVGKGMLIEENPRLRSLDGLSKLTSIGGNCVIAGNRLLTGLAGLESLTSINGNLQIVDNPFLAELSALAKLSRINGLLLLYKNVGLKSLAGLDSIDPAGIKDLGILSCDILTSCSVQSVCDYLDVPANQSSISRNGNGCNFAVQILQACRRTGTDSSPPKRQDPIFSPNPTSGVIAVKGEGLKNASIEVMDHIGRILIKAPLDQNRIDLSDLAAGMYFIQLNAETFQLVRKVVKVN